MKNTRGSQEKPNLSLKQIRKLMEAEPSPLLPTRVEDQESDIEFFGVLTDTERKKFTEEIGDSQRR